MSDELIELARKIRLHVLDMVTYSKTSHIGASYSIVEILVTLYFKILNIDPLDLKIKLGINSFSVKLMGVLLFMPHYLKKDVLQRCF